MIMLGGGFLQSFVIKKARGLGYYVYCLDANPNASGFKFANESAVINIVDEEACLAYAREKKIDGVLTAATDYSVLTMSRIAKELGLPGINYDSARLIKNKASGVPTIIYQLSGIPEEYYNYCFTVDDLSVEALTDKLMSIIELPQDKLSDIGAKARKFIHENKSPRNQSMKIINLINEL